MTISFADIPSIDGSDHDGLKSVACMWHGATLQQHMYIQSERQRSEERLPRSECYIGSAYGMQNTNRMVPGHFRGIPSGLH